MNFSTLELHDELSHWLQVRFGAEGPGKLIESDAGLDRIAATFKPFLDQLKSPKVITVAGTNGKGETAYRIERQLLTQNKRVALWTSPHLLSVCERLRFDGKDIDVKRCMALFEKLEPLSKNLSYYEFLFLVFLQACIEQSPDVLVLEVGLGGRLDTVNLLDTDLALVCSIGLDHQAILGDTPEKILYEKLGVCRRDKLCLTALDDPRLRAQAKAWCQARSVPWWDGFEEKQLHLEDTYPRRNQVLSSAALGVFSGGADFLANFNSKTIKNDQLSFSGRREVMTLGAQRFIFIGAHNIDGFRQAVHFWSHTGFPDEIWSAFSNRPRADLSICVELLAQTPKHVKKIVTTFDHARALTSELASSLSNETSGRVEFVSDWKSLINQQDAKTIAIAGSYYFIASFMRELLLRGATR
ncbi:MAG: hypothetical protein CME71_12960 [Halobacteriovorax sp.]|nr:hypothetical protein [Halobacteriovorax sp.]